jgi:hypothetical protein
MVNRVLLLDYGVAKIYKNCKKHDYKNSGTLPIYPDVNLNAVDAAEIP